jgi:hypothetical protein
LFILVRTTTKSIQFIKKTSIFILIHSILSAKQQQQKWIFRTKHKNRAVKLLNKNFFVIANIQKKKTDSRAPKMCKIASKEVK